MPKEPAYVLTVDAKELLKAVGVIMQKSADNTFAIGKALERSKEAIPHNAWAKAIRPLGLTVKTAYNYMSVFRALSDYRAELVEADIGPTVMYQLARNPLSVATVLEAYRRGERLSVANVRKLVDEALGVKPKPTVDVLNLGGMSGLRRAAAAKVKSDMAEFVRLIKVILEFVEEAMKPMAEGKRVKKGPLAAAIVYDCRHACDLVNALAAPLGAGAPTRHLNLAPHKLPAGSGWGKVQALLYQLGAEPAWPAADVLETWLVVEVVPMLRFVAHGEAMAGAVPDLNDPTTAARETADHSEQEAIASSLVTFDAEANSEADTAIAALEAGLRMAVVAPPLALDELVEAPAELVNLAD
jgi:hypothetical protein